MRTLLSIVLVCAIASGCRMSSSPKQQASPKQVPSSSKQQETDKSASSKDYREIVDTLVNQILALRKSHTSLAELQVLQDGRPDRIWLHFTCEHGITGQQPNPDWTPGVKLERNLPVFADDGLDLNVYIHVGCYPGSAVTPQIAVVQDLNVSIFARGPKAEEVRTKIKDVVARVRERYTEVGFQPSR